MYSCNSNSGLKLYKEIDLYKETQFPKYELVYQKANDTFQKMVEQKNGFVKPMIFGTWEIDKVFYMNSGGTRLFSRINIQYNRVGETMDVGIEFIGAKVGGKWYFLTGDQVVYPRGHFKADVTQPYSFEELSYLFNYKLFPRIITEKNSHYKVSELFFEKLLKNLNAGLPGSDSLFIKKTNQWMQHRMEQYELDKITSSIRNSKPLTKAKQTFWKKVFSKKKLFDSHAWKNRNK